MINPTVKLNDIRPNDKNDIKKFIGENKHKPIVKLVDIRAEEKKIIKNGLLLNKRYKSRKDMMSKKSDKEIFDMKSRGERTETCGRKVKYYKGFDKNFNIKVDTKSNNNGSMKCLKCNITFSKWGNLRRHITTLHDDRKYKCLNHRCSYDTACIDTMTGHCRTQYDVVEPLKGTHYFEHYNYLNPHSGTNVEKGTIQHKSKYMIREKKDKK